MITMEIETVGVAEVASRFASMDARMTEELRASVSRLSITLQRKVVQDKLSGQVLGVRTGRGRRSIHQDVAVTGDTVSGVVSTNLFYMAGWETGWFGSDRQTAQLRAGKAKFSAGGGGGDTFKNGTPKQREFLVPTLRELNESGAIDREFELAVGRAAQ